MNFKSFKISEWQQFQNIEIDFHERLTILTGANGSGKTTILNILAIHFGWSISLCATPKKDKKTGTLSYLFRYFNGENKNEENNIGYIMYSSNEKANLALPDKDKNTLQYQINLKGQQEVKCIFIPSHRSNFRYQKVSSTPLVKKDKQTAFQEVSNSTKERYIGNNNNQATSFFIKNTLISWAYQGFKLIDNKGKEINTPDEEQAKFYEGFKNVLKKILPKSLGFDDFEIRDNEVMFICNHGNDEFPLEQASGGVSTLIEISWLIYMYSTKENVNFTVIIDEIENHLHPTMQRQVLPDLLNAFPEVSFIVSTHSPLIVGSVRDSRVYVLKYDEFGKINSEKLDLINQAKTATEILDEVLGVSFTMPIWAEEKLIKIVDKYSSKDMTKKDFGNMRCELKEIGLEKLMPEAIYNLIGKKDDKNQ